MNREKAGWLAGNQAQIGGELKNNKQARQRADERPLAVSLSLASYPASTQLQTGSYNAAPGTLTRPTPTVTSRHYFKSSHSDWPASDEDAAPRTRLTGPLPRERRVGGRILHLARLH